MLAGLVGPTIRKSALDGRGNLWVGTSSGVSKISSATASIKNISDENVDFTVYPNPSNDYINISYKSKSSSLVEINVYNAQWQSVKQQSFGRNDDKLKLSISEQPPGVYYVKCGQQVKQLLIH